MNSKGSRSAYLRKNIIFVGMKVGSKIGGRPLLQECLIYVVIWVFVFLFPIANEAAMSASHSLPFLWKPVFRAWMGTLPFLVLFLIQRFILIPRFYHSGRYKIYVALLLIAFGVFMASQYALTNTPPPSRYHEHQRMGPPPPYDIKGHPLYKKSPRPPRNHISRMPMLMNSVIALFMLGFTITLYLMFKNQSEKEMREKLESLRLRDELKYLRSQVNPHFFMNMLNNIHALVDIEPQKAKKVIIGLSKLMRHSLYDAEKQTTSLVSEIEFIANYLDLMRVRYPEDIVKISLAVPEKSSDDKRMPPLLFIPLLENAFKHGVSYVNPTIIDVKISEQDDMVTFTCCNTRPVKPTLEDRGGLGLVNVRRRLRLLYGSDDMLVIKDEKDTYNVSLTIPTV